MKFVLSSYGTRGEVEPLVGIGRELLRRGHDVQMVVPPDLVEFTVAAGLAAVAYRMDSQALIEAYRKYCAYHFESSWKVSREKSRAKARLARDSAVLGAQCEAETRNTLMSLALGADLLLTGQNFEHSAADVAEVLGIPLATVHLTPIRVNGQVSTFLPPVLDVLSPSLLRAAMAATDWLNWRAKRKTEDAERRKLALPKATGHWSWGIAERGSLEIQAYDDVLLPSLAAEWAHWEGQRPFVGALAMELPTDSDEEVLSWIAEGTPPIFFGFGSMPVESAADTVAMIAVVCAQLGERALIGSGSSDFSGRIPHFDHVKVTGAVNYAAIFPACRAIVHHGSNGTTAAGLRAGLPTLILWLIHDQRVWATQIKRLKVGTARHISATTEKSLAADLRQILGPQYLARAREIATRMTKPADSVSNAADLVEDLARARRAG